MSEFKGEQVNSKIRKVILVATFALGSVVTVGSPAQAASCDTELGDMCKAIGVVCDDLYRVNPKVWALTSCPNW
ncbi:MAG TPA: hypothetical protein VE174_07195 [Actinomycetota bacterium]|nr:hypothetical protein [Actinomycetota bacterium]